MVGPAPSGCDNGSTMAEQGLRYIEVSDATGGQVQSICSNDYASLLDEVGTVGLAYKTAYELSQPAASESIVVTIDGAVCAIGWSYDPVKNQVIFNPDGPCFPGPGEGFSVSYQSSCP